MIKHVRPVGLSWKERLWSLRIDFEVFIIIHRIQILFFFYLNMIFKCHQLQIPNTNTSFLSTSLHFIIFWGGRAYNQKQARNREDCDEECRVTNQISWGQKLHTMQFIICLVHHHHLSLASCSTTVWFKLNIKLGGTCHQYNTKIIISQFIWWQARAITSKGT